MTSSRCLACHGSGKVMANGMVYRDCVKCDAEGVIYSDEIEKPKIAVNIDKRSAEYKTAIKKIMESGSTKEEAAKIFDEEFEKL
jgi:hypothetical protein